MAFASSSGSSPTDRRDVLDQQRAQLVVGLAHRAILVRPRGVDPDHRRATPPPYARTSRSGTTWRSTARGSAASASRPECPRGSRGVGQDPRRRALEYHDVAGLLGDLGNELERAGAGADDGDALAAEIVLVLPARRMEGDACEAFAPGDVREARPVRAGPTALITRVRLEVSGRAVLARAPAPSSGARARPRPPPRPRSRSGCGRADCTRRRSAGSSRAARPAARSAAASRWARTSSE